MLLFLYVVLQLGSVWGARLLWWVLHPGERTVWKPRGLGGATAQSCLNNACSAGKKIVFRKNNSAILPRWKSAQFLDRCICNCHFLCSIIATTASVLPWALGNHINQFCYIKVPVFSLPLIVPVWLTTCFISCDQSQYSCLWPNQNLTRRMEQSTGQQEIFL